MRRQSEQPLATLAQWIGDGRAVSFAWQGRAMLPMFQFEPSTMSLWPSASAGVAWQLQAVFDGWELALWFAQPNAWLSDWAPVGIFFNPMAPTRAERRPSGPVHRCRVTRRAAVWSPRTNTKVLFTPSSRVGSSCACGH